MLPALSHQPIGGGGCSAPDLVPFHRAYFLVAQLPPGTSPISWVFILFCTPGAMPRALCLGALGLRSYFALSITMGTRALLPHHRSQSKVHLPHCKTLLKAATFHVLPGPNVGIRSGNICPRKSRFSDKCDPCDKEENHNQDSTGTPYFSNPTEASSVIYWNKFRVITC